MTFGDALIRYFSNVLDVTMYIQFFMFSLALVILSLSKEFTRKNLLFSLLKLVILYVCYIFGESFLFASCIQLSPKVGGIIFTATFAIIPIVYLVFFVKDRVLHKVIKLLVIVATLLITSEIGRALGVMVAEVSGNNQFLVIVSRIAPVLLIPFVSFIQFKFNISRFANLPRTSVAMLFVLAIVLSVSAIWANFLNVTNFSGRTLLIFMSIFALFVLVGIYYSIYSIIDYRHRITELEVASSVLAIEKEALEIDITNREELMKIRHDLKNQLSYTSVLLNDGKYKEADEYIKGLINQKEEYLYSFSCSNLVISGIVNLELTKASIADKKIKFKVVVPPKLPFEDSDLLSLITNIVDNSIENFVPADEKDEINVSIVTQQDYLRVTAFNSVKKDAIKGKPTLKTTKRNRGHGYGTKIIKNIVKKYEGHATFTFEDDKFVCDCLINMNHQGNKNA